MTGRGQRRGVRAEAEELLFPQAARIDAVDAIEPSSAGSPTVFFVGFAGYAEQRVFAEEIKLAARVVGERYGLEKRSIFLINDRRRSMRSRSPARLHACATRCVPWRGEMNTNATSCFVSPRTVTSTR